MKIGIVGGGQLGMMMIEAFDDDVYTVVIDPNKNCSASYVCDELLVGNYNDEILLKKLSDSVDIITYEFENVSVDALMKYCDNKKIVQSLDLLRISQHRLLEKQKAKESGLDVGFFEKVRSKEQLVKYLNKYKKLVYKTSMFGYDGNSQIIIDNVNKLELIDYSVDAIVEEYINYDYELSVLVLRSKKSCVVYPVSINKHNNHILYRSVITDINQHLYTKLKNDVMEFMKKNNYYGILCIEFFKSNNKFIFNEMAPRVHNSYHHTIESCNISQFKALYYLLTDKKIDSINLLSNSIMYNILGKNYYYFNIYKNINNVFIHNYHKDIRPKRKIGHVTFIGISKKEIKRYLYEF